MTHAQSQFQADGCITSILRFVTAQRRGFVCMLEFPIALHNLIT